MQADFNCRLEYDLGGVITAQKENTVFSLIFSFTLHLPATLAVDIPKLANSKVQWVR